VLKHWPQAWIITHQPHLSFTHQQTREGTDVGALTLALQRRCLLRKSFSWVHEIRRDFASSLLYAMFVCVACRRCCRHWACFSCSCYSNSWLSRCQLHLRRRHLLGLRDPWVMFLRSTVICLHRSSPSRPRCSVVPLAHLLPQTVLHQSLIRWFGDFHGHFVLLLELKASRFLWFTKEIL